MGMYLVMEITEYEISKVVDEKIFVFDILEVESSDLPIGEYNRSGTFGNTSKYSISVKDELSEKLVKAARNKEMFSLNLNEFTLTNKDIENQDTEIYQHDSVRLIEKSRYKVVEVFEYKIISAKKNGYIFKMQKILDPYPSILDDSNIFFRSGVSLFFISKEHSLSKKLLKYLNLEKFVILNFNHFILRKEFVDNKSVLVYIHDSIIEIEKSRVFYPIIYNEEKIIAFAELLKLGVVPIPEDENLLLSINTDDEYVFYFQSEYRDNLLERLSNIHVYLPNISWQNTFRYGRISSSLNHSFSQTVGENNFKQYNDVFTNHS